MLAVLKDIWRYKGLVLGSPTYDVKLFPPMDSLVRLLRDKMVQIVMSVSLEITVGPEER